MTRARWKGRVLRKAEAQELIASSGWTLDERASRVRGAPIYSGPNGQLIIIGFIKTDRPRLIISGGDEYLDLLYHPPRTVTVVGGFHLKPTILLRLLPEGVRAEMEIDRDPEHSMANYPERDIEPDGERFLKLLVAIGNRIIEIEPSFHWQVMTSDGIMTSINLVSDGHAMAIDARVYKQIWDRLSKSKIENVDIEFYADLNLRFPT